MGKKKQTCSLDMYLCTLGYEGASFYIGIQYFSVHLEYILGEDGHKIEVIYNIPSTGRWEDKSRQEDFGAASKGIQPEASEELG